MYQSYNSFGNIHCGYTEVNVLPSITTIDHDISRFTMSIMIAS